MGDPYFGVGLVDKNGNALNVGDSVIFLGVRYVLRLENWNDPDEGMVKRIAISGGSYWLTPYTAGMCERVN